MKGLKTDKRVCVGRYGCAWSKFPLVPQVYASFISIYIFWWHAGKTTMEKRRLARRRRRGCRENGMRGCMNNCHTKKDIKK